MHKRPPAPLAAAILLVAVLATLALARSRHVEPPALPEPPSAPRPPTPLAQGGPLDLNRASASDLELLPRIGPTLARRIVEEREQRGPFRSLEDVSERVRGIGPRTLEGLRGLAEIPALPP